MARGDPDFGRRMSLKFKALRREGPPKITVKTCNRCWENKDIASFKITYGPKRIDGTRSMNYAGHCKACRNKQERPKRRKFPDKNMIAKAWRELWPKASSLVNTAREHWSYEVFRRYKISESQYEASYKKQNGKCALCTKTEAEIATRKFPRFVVDHDHDNNYVRGLLCHPCNVRLGKTKDNPAWMWNAIQYLAVPFALV